MGFEYSYHKSIEVLHLGCEKPRAYFVPYHSEAAALTDNRANSARFFSLCGDWDFRFYPTPSKIDNFTTPAFDRSGMDKMIVPRSWQTVLGKGYDTPNYTNVSYPYPLDPPHTPDDNPSALYVRDFTLTSDYLDGREIYINFEGVDSCFYLYINNNFVGYSQVSHNTSEFCITKYVREGNNNIKVLVFKWCDGSYLEDQDKFRFSGIFREVYLLSRDKVHIKDLYVRTNLNASYSQAVVSVNTLLCGESEVEYKLLGVSGTEESGGSLTVNTEGTFELLVASPKLWSDEVPNLYTLVLKCGDEFISIPVGIREIVIKNRVVYINGKKVKARGVNRHDSHPILGSATPMDHMLEDLYILKRHNFNMVRTSHYPNDPRFYTLCDRLGFYVCDEMDYESHGMQRIGQWDYFSESPEYTGVLLDRCERMFERDKNHPCVIMWSLGNENGAGDNQKIMSDYIRSRMPGSIVHCEDICRRLRDVKHEEGSKYYGVTDVDWVDIESRMYPSHEEMFSYIHNKKFAYPYFMCEYCHAMGNGPGDLAQYWEIIYANDNFFGGCVWEYTDHSVATGDNIYADPHYIYGGDFGDYPHDGNFCVDGVVYPDRRPSTGLREHKQVTRPFAISEVSADGSFRIRSRRCFTSLEDLCLFWSVERDGKVIRDGLIPTLKVPAERSRKYQLDFSGLDLYGDVTVNFSVRQLHATPWAEAGYEVASEQFELPAAARPKKTTIPSTSTLTTETTDDEFIISTASTEYRVSRYSGLITSLIDEGKQMLDSPIVPTIFRAPTDNDRRIKRDWHANKFDIAKTKCYSISLAEADDKSATIEASLSLGGVILQPILFMDVKYTFTNAGDVILTFDVTKRKDLRPTLPRFGVEFKMPEGNEKIEYFGRGPGESYVDERNSSRLGRFSSSVHDHFEHYIKPQENMAHVDTRWVAITNDVRHGLLCLCVDAPISFNCSHFTPKQISETAHDYELVPLKQTVVNLDYKHTGIGSHSCGPELLDQFKFSETEFTYRVRILPVHFNDVDPFAELS